MNITSASSAYATCAPAAASATSGPTATPAASTGADAVSDGNATPHPHHVRHGGGGRMRGAVDDALKSVDPQAATDGTSAASKQDSGDLMHALFEAVKAQSPATTDGSAPTDPKAAFGSGLSALITEVGNGQAPAALQSAYAKLAPDAQGSLQNFLSALQQNLGYGASSASTTAAVGNAISTQV